MICRCSFKKKPEPAPAPTGADVVREALRIRAKSASFSTATLARDFSVPESVLTNFIASGVRPRAEIMAKLVSFLFHGRVVWDEALDRLKSANANPARPLGVRPPASPVNLPPGMPPREPGVFVYPPPVFDEPQGSSSSYRKTPGWG